MGRNSRSKAEQGSDSHRSLKGSIPAASGSDSDVGSRPAAAELRHTAAARMLRREAPAAERPSCPHPPSRPCCNATPCTSAAGPAAGTAGGPGCTPPWGALPSGNTTRGRGAGGQGVHRAGGGGVVARKRAVGRCSGTPAM